MAFLFAHAFSAAGHQSLLPLSIMRMAPSGERRIGFRSRIISTILLAPQFSLVSAVSSTSLILDDGQFGSAVKPYEGITISNEPKVCWCFRTFYFLYKVLGWTCWEFTLQIMLSKVEAQNLSPFLILVHYQIDYSKILLTARWFWCRRMWILVKQVLVFIVVCIILRTSKK